MISPIFCLFVTFAVVTSARPNLRIGNVADTMRSLMLETSLTQRDENREASSSLSTWDNTLQADPTMFDSCSNIFIDVGANRGTHVRKLFEPEKYNGSLYLQVFDDAFGSPEHRMKPFAITGLCAFGFEANYRQASHLKKIEEAYTKQGWRVRFFSPFAVGNSSGKQLQLNLNDDPSHSDWGAGIKKWGRGGEVVKVPQTSLAEFMQELHQHSKPGFKLMKMDIESSEYLVLPPFVTNHLLCRKFLNKLSIEWHESALEPAEVPNAQRLRQTVENPAQDNCGHNDLPTDVVTIDDESYLNDGMPLPM